MVLVPQLAAQSNPGGMTLDIPLDPSGMIEQGEMVKVNVEFDGGSEGVWYDAEGLQYQRGYHEHNGFCTDPCLKDDEVQFYSECCFYYCQSCAWYSSHEFSPSWYGMPTWEFKVTACETVYITAHYYGGSHQGPYDTIEYEIPVKTDEDEASFISEPPVPTFCVGEQVEFIDTTCSSDILDRSWYFPGDPVNPGPYVSFDTVRRIFNTPGEYEVELTVDTTTKTLMQSMTFEVVEGCAQVRGLVWWRDPEMPPDSEEPIPGATVSVAGGTRDVESDFAGYYALTLPDGTHDLIVEAPGFFGSSAQIALDPQEVRTMDFRLEHDGIYDHELHTELGNAVPSTGEPVNPSVGNFYVSKPLFGFPAAGLPFGFNIMYNSLDPTYDGPLGFGWSHGYDITLTMVGNDVTIKWGDGRRETFVYEPGTDSYSPSSPHSVVELAGLDPAGWVATVPDDYAFEFDGSGRLVRLGSRTGLEITLSYSTYLDRIVDAGGRQIDFTYAGHRIDSITSPLVAGNTAEFQYDGAGDLVGIVDPRGNTWNYTYDGAHRLLTEVDAKGVTVLTNTYDGDGRVETQLDSDLNATTYSYAGEGSLEAHRTTVTFPGGRTATFSFDLAYSLTRTEDGQGDGAEFRYDSEGNMVAAYDKMGRKTSVAYDQDGFPTSVTDPADKTWSIDWNAEGSLTGFTDSKGATTTLTYDANELMVGLRDPVGGEYTFGYDGAGRPLTMSNSGGATWSWTYGAQGLLESRQDPLGGAKTYTYDGAGRVTQVDRTDSGPWQFDFDGNSNLVLVVDPLGNQATMTYDNNNNLESTTMPFDGVDTATTTYEYDSWVAPRNRLVRIVDDLGGEINATYRLDSTAIESITDADGVTRSFEYDNANRLTAVVGPAGGRTEYGYDSNGNTTSIEDALHNVWLFRYDDNNLLLEIEDPIGNIWSMTRDELGRPAVVHDPERRSTLFLYDRVGRPTFRVLSDGTTEGRGYDAVGNLARVRDGLGRSWRFTHDDANRMVSRIDPLGRAETYERDGVGRVLRRTTRDGQEIDFTYDLLGRLETVALPGAGTTTFGYDPAGNLVSVIDDNGTTSMTYDTLRRRLTRTDPFGKTIGFGYSAAGRLETITYPDTNAVTREYDTAGRLWRITDWLSNITTISYDALSRPQRIDLPNGTRTEYGYGADGRLESLTHLHADDSVIVGYVLARNAAGQVTTVDRTGNLAEDFADSRMVTTHDEANRLLEQTTDTTQVNLEHDRDGNLVSRTVAGSTTIFTYDGDDRLVSVDDGSSLTTYTYDGLGNRIARTHDGVTTRYVGDPLQPYCTTDGAGTIQRYFVTGDTVLYSLDASGNISVLHTDVRGSVVAISDASGAVTASRAFSPYGRELAAIGASDIELGFLGAWGTVTDENGLVFMHARYFDPVSRRFLNEDPLGIRPSLNLFAYVGGDPANFIDPLGTDDQPGEPGGGPVTITPISKETRETAGQIQTWVLNVAMPAMDLAGDLVGNIGPAHIGADALRISSGFKNVPAVKYAGVVDLGINTTFFVDTAFNVSHGTEHSAMLYHDAALIANSGMGFIPGYSLTIGNMIGLADKESARVSNHTMTEAYINLQKYGPDKAREITADPTPSGVYGTIYLGAHFSLYGVASQTFGEYIERNMMLGDDLPMSEIVQAGWQRWKTNTDAWFFSGD